MIHKLSNHSTWILGALLLLCFVFAFASWRTAPRKYVINDEAIELLQSDYLSPNGFSVLITGYEVAGEGTTDWIESLVPYVNHAIQRLLGKGLGVLHLAYALCHCVAAFLLYRLGRRVFRDERLAWAALFIFGVSSYASFYARILTRNGISCLWTAAMLLLTFLALQPASPRRRALLWCVGLPGVLVASLLSYTSFKFLVPSLLLSLWVISLTLLFRKQWTLRDLVYPFLLSLITVGTFGILLLISQIPLRFALLRGGYVLENDVLRQYLPHLVQSILLPILNPPKEGFVIDITHAEFDRSTLPLLMAPFVVIGAIRWIYGALRGDSFRGFLILFGLVSVAILSMGGPNLKHQFCLFPVSVLFAVEGVGLLMKPLGKISKWIPVLALMGIGLAYAWGEAHRIFVTLPAKDVMRFNAECPQAVAQEVLSLTRAGRKVYVMDGYCRDAVRYHLRGYENVQFVSTSYAGEDLVKDVAAGQTVAYVCLIFPPTGPDVLPALANALPLVEYKEVREEAGRWVIRYWVLGSGGVVSSASSSSDAASSSASIPLNQPRGVCVTPNGFIGVADFRNHRIQVLDQALAVLSTIGEVGQGAAGLSQFNEPCDIKMDPQGILYVADCMNGRIQKINTSDGAISTLASGLFAPRGLAVSRDGTRIYVTETGNAAVHVFSSDGQELAKWGGLGSAEGQMNTPVGVDVDQDGNVWVAERTNARVQIFDPQGKTKATWAIESWKNECLDSEPYLALGPEGQVALTDPGNNAVLLYGPDGKLVSRATQSGGQDLNRPSGLAWFPDGRLVVSDTWNHRICILSPSDLKPAPTP